MTMKSISLVRRPSAIEIGQRALAVRALIARGDLEYGFQDDDGQEEEDWEGQFEGFRSWLSSDGSIHKFFTAKEFYLATAPLGSWETEDLLLNGGYWMEALGVLFWSLCKLDMPKPGEDFDHQNLVYDHPYLNNSEMFLKGLKVRPIKEIVKARDFTFGYLLRLFERVCPPDDVQQRIALQNLNQGVAWELNARKLIPGLINGDLPILNQAVDDLSDEDAVDLFLILKVRLAAIHWVLGVFADWERPIHTPQKGYAHFSFSIHDN